MTREEAISYIAATEWQCSGEFAFTEEQREYSMSECREALRVLGVAEDEITSLT